MGACKTCGGDSSTQPRRRIDVPCKCGSNVDVSTIDAQRGAMVVHNTLDPTQDWDKVDITNANTMKWVRCPYTTYVPPAVWCSTCQANLMPQWKELCVSGTSAEVEAAEWNYHPTATLYRQMARDFIRQHGPLKRVEYLSHFPKFEINFVFDRKTVHSGQRRGEYDIHFLSLGYVGEGPRYARFFLDEAGFTMSSEEINAIRPGAIIELRQGRVVVSYPDKDDKVTITELPRQSRTMNPGRDVPLPPERAQPGEVQVQKRWWQFWR